ncbi:NAD-dependent epimerase/dehydratase family protein [uncultured Roseivirga sp.]|uniref:NAD-dependent epimerase/dehydratase family protein n=1 Tax=uncultured Roseivirga sp. TaxID=543088 RepID=UPI000D797734|nr:NAD-dependent epimerase/dehydratase family protein [uncultured Roseivirga sp.]PWL30938.1 MAG: UDP-N-acetylglucosamine 4-epimerase [Roseivirga sp. XM-24bin3]
MIGVVGGSGFVGSFLMKEINSRGAFIYDKRPSPFFNDQTTIGNVLDKTLLNQFVTGKESIVLLAAEHRDDVSPTSLYYDVNVEGTRNVLEAMDKQGVKHLIFTSSVAIYGLNKENPDEEHPENPFNHYGKSKWLAEELIKVWYEKDPLNKSVTIIRPTVIFGERNRGNVYNLLKQIASGRFLMIGSGKNKKSMAYVGNVVSFIKHLLTNKSSGFQVFNYVDKPDFNMTELVRVIEKKMNISIPEQNIPYWIGMLGGYAFDFLAFFRKKKTSISSVRVKKFCATTQFDARKVHSTFSAPFTLQEGLERTLEHEFINPQKDEVLFYSE